VRSELDQWLKLAVLNGVLFHFSINATELDTMYVKLKLICLHVTVIAVEIKTFLNILIEGFYLYDIQQIMFMRRNIFSCVACLTLQYNLQYFKYGNVSKNN
jgi:hypothetical protein